MASEDARRGHLDRTLPPQEGALLLLADATQDLVGQAETGSLRSPVEDPRPQLAVVVRPIARCQYREPSCAPLGPNGRGPVALAVGFHDRSQRGVALDHFLGPRR